MKMVLMGIGAILVIFGLVDLVGSYTDFDLWGKIGIQLPEMIWKYSAYIEIALGAVLFKLGMGSGDKAADS